MDRGFLEEYEYEEVKEFNKCHKSLFDRKFSVYPPDSRFTLLQYPVSRAWQNQNPIHPSIIWPQIPLTGSLIIAVYPVPKENFKELHGFEVEDIDKLVEFAKETGKVQFMLHTLPRRYVTLDYLDPIFELKPPLECRFSVEALFSRQEEIMEHRRIFYEKAKIGLRPLLDHIFTTSLPKANTQLLKEAKDGQLDWLFKDYLLLRALEKNDVAEQVLDLLLEDPMSATIVLNVYHYCLYIPLLDTRRAFSNFDFASFTMFGQHLSEQDRVELLSNIKFPCEIGGFLFKKATPYPQSFRAMTYLYENYRKEDLYNVMEALNKGLKSRSTDLFSMKAAELSEIFENIWQDSKRLKQRMKGINFGISISLGVLGPILGFLTIGLPGLLAAFGLAIGEKTIDFFGTSIGEKIVEWLRPDYLLSIYDFQNRYSIE